VVFDRLASAIVLAILYSSDRVRTLPDGWGRLVAVDGEHSAGADQWWGAIVTDTITRPRLTWEELLQSYGRAHTQSEVARRVELALTTDRSKNLSIGFPHDLSDEVAQRLGMLDEMRTDRLPG